MVLSEFLKFIYVFSEQFEKKTWKFLWRYFESSKKGTNIFFFKSLWPFQNISGLEYMKHIIPHVNETLKNGPSGTIRKVTHAIFQEAWFLSYHAISLECRNPFSRRGRNYEFSTSHEMQFQFTMSGKTTSGRNWDWLECREVENSLTIRQCLILKN